jgi:GNAT superfamily N-acetyltransferase
MSGALSIEVLSAEDAPANVALSRSVGWQDVESDWRVLHAAARVLGMRRDGRLIAQGALGDYGSAASLAKMVVAPEQQGQGIGRRLLEALIDEPCSRGLPIGLCATELGRPLYEKCGFSVSGELMILFGTPRPETGRAAMIVPLGDEVSVVELERGFVTCDRSRMLRARFAEASARFCSIDSDAPGFVLASRFEGASLVGPLFARSESVARELARAIFAALPGPIRIDVPLQHTAFRNWLVELGLREHSLRVEMARGATCLPWQVPERFALATQAFG